ncbi:4Fe-4S dicluster domain-containing protein [Piscinibacter aquaticus]|uniref:4Fe-4S dicluster domain-containing protein n=1 Tax=Piscinibacter aquaticus TaxID=392597 RepID=A0A5C6TZJ8_9BURK|nr:4Fe-4S dicluster domain-containing protein [Piscinibacter aquaticus]
MGRTLPEELPSDDGPGEAGSAAAPGEALLAGVRQGGLGGHHTGPARHADGLCAEHPQVHRLPALREGLRRGEQPVARRASGRAHRVDPGAAHGARPVRRPEDGPGLSRRTGHPGRRQCLHAGRPVLEGQYHYTPEKVPEADATYMPIACMQCEKPPCVKVCPVRTTYREADGPVVIDYNWCIGCKMCMNACPYWARRFNLTTPVLPKQDMNPVTHYLGNRPRMRGVVEKCHWCLQRTRHGRYPACVEVCPVGARKFGNLLDPESEVSKVLARKNVFRLKAEANTFPKFFYFYD